MTSTALVPFRSFAGGKSRLAPFLGPDDRASLCRAMLRRTMRVVSGFDRVIVVSDDPEVAEMAELRDPRVSFFMPQVAGDLNAALNDALARADADHVKAVVPVDLVLLGRADLDALVDGLRADTRIAVVSDRHQAGTNLLLLPPGVQKFGFSFGAGSFARHVAEALRLGCTPRRIEQGAAAFDLDTGQDLADYLARTPVPGCEVSGWASALDHRQAVERVA